VDVLISLCFQLDVAREVSVSVGHVDTGIYESIGCAGAGAQPGELAGAGILAEVVTVPISALRSGESPRQEGEDRAHIARLAAMEAQLPPVLVDRHSMRVIDGMHRLLAASMQGHDTIEVQFFDGRPEDAFLRAVQANVTHGLPLSQSDRRVAAERIIESHPQLSDRAIAQLAGLSAKTVGGIRRSAAGPQLSARVGKDGKVRPLNSVEGRRRAAELLSERPQASLREAARGAGVSPGTVRDVRRRLERGEEPAPARPDAAGRVRRANAAEHPDGPAGQAAGSGGRRAVRAMRQAPAFVLDKLLRDPSLRHKEQGRRLLRWLQHNPAGPQERSYVIAAVPPHCAALVVQLARENAQMWSDFAQELDERVQVLDPWVGGQANPPP
jgi:ParB-like nuclease domain